MLQKNAVSGQNAANFLKTTKDEMGCCGGAKLDCQYTATYTQANTVSALTLTEEGVDVALPLTIGAAATAATVQSALLAALVLAEYYDDDNADWPGVVVTDLGSTLQIVITGNLIVKSLTASGGTSTFDADCTLLNQCTFAVKGFTAGAGSALHINGTTQSLGTITPGTTSAGDVKTAVESALTTAGFTATATVTANGSTDYDISIASLPFATSLYFVGASAVKFYADKSACVQSYV